MRKVDDILKDIKLKENEKKELEKELNQVVASSDACKKRKDTPMSGNIGEWSEIYVFYKLLHDGKIRSARIDDDGIIRSNKESYLPVIKIIRQEDGFPIEYYTSNDLNGVNALKVFYKGFSEPLFERTQEDYKEKANDLYNILNQISRKKNFTKLGITKEINPKTNKPIKGTYGIPHHKAFLNDILISKVKAPSKEISNSFGGITDITLEIIRQDNVRVPVGFSVKSSIGKPAALLNSSGPTTAHFVLKNVSKKAMNDINSKVQLTERVKELLKRKSIKVVFDHFESPVFESNLKLIADREPEVLGYSVLYSYGEHVSGSGSNRKIKDVMKSLVKYDPLNIGDGKEKYYEKRLKDLLFERACGMEPAKAWNGETKISGGFILVSPNGDISAFYASDQEKYKNWLLNNTKFDTPSTQRQKVGIVRPVKNGKRGECTFALNVLIKFTC